MNKIKRREIDEKEDKEKKEKEEKERLKPKHRMMSYSPYFTV